MAFHTKEIRKERWERGFASFHREIEAEAAKGLAEFSVVARLYWFPGRYDDTVPLLVSRLEGLGHAVLGVDRGTDPAMAIFRLAAGSAVVGVPGETRPG